MRRPSAQVKTPLSGAPHAAAPRLPPLFLRPSVAPLRALSWVLTLGGTESNVELLVLPGEGKVLQEEGKKTWVLSKYTAS